MTKIADVYYNSNPWSIIEEGFNPAYSLVSESIFSLGNEYMGVRGYFEEGYSGDRLVGSYFNGIYESQSVEASAYKGMITKTEFIVNAVDWLYLRIQVAGETVDLNYSEFRDFKRELNLRTGVLNRSYLWVLKDGRELKLEFERFLSMPKVHYAGQRIRMTALNFSGEVVVTAGLDFSNVHHMVGKNLWDCKERNAGEKWCSILADTINTNQSVFSCSYFTGDAKKEQDIVESKKVLKKFTFYLEPHKTEILTRVCINQIKKEDSLEEEEAFLRNCRNCEGTFHWADYDTLKADSAKWWERMWEDSDIAIDGDELNQQGIRFCIFQMHQTYHGADRGAIIGAKGLTGEAYSGNTFWDTETYCLPFYIFFR